MNRATLIRILRYFLAITLLSLMVGFIQLYHVPKLKSWILFEVQRFSKTSLPADIIAGEVRFRFWPPGVEFRNVGVTPKDDLLNVLLPLKLDKVTATVSPIGLLKGQLRIGRLFLQGGDVRVFIRENTKTKPATDIKIDWNNIYQLPVDQVAISRIHLAVDSDVGNFKGSVQKLAVRVHNRNQSLRVRILADDLRVKKDENELETDLVSDFVIDENGIYFQGIRLRRETSFLFASGRMSGNMSTLKFNESDFKLRSQFNLKEVTTLLRDILGQQKIPQLGGTAFITSDIQYDFKKLPNAVTQVEGSDISVNQFKVGNVIFASQIKNQQLQIQSLKIANPGATIELHKTQLQTESPYKFSTEVRGEKVHIKRLLASIGIDGVPVESDFKFAIPCTGHIEPSPELNCEGSLREGWTKVASDNGKTIVEFDKAEVDGKFKVTKQNVSYNAQVRIGKSRAQTDGVISYEKGFNINYTSDLARFEDFKNLVNLKLTGESQIKGKTQGTSKSATFQLALNGKNIWFDDFGLGDVTTNMSYRAGNIYFNDAQGKMNQTHYQGQIRFDINKNILDVSGRAPFVSIEDVQFMINRRVPLPIKITGTGSATFKIRGPPELNKLSSTVNSSFFRGDISGESYDQLHLSVQSVDGFLTTDRVQIIKGPSIASLTGTLSPKGEVKAYATAKNFYVDQSEFLKSLNLNVAGNLNMEAEFGGLFLKPEIKAKGTIINMMVGNRPASNSNFDFKLNEKEIDGHATLMGENILVAYKWPFNDGPYALSVKANKWNFAQFFNITNDTPRAITHMTELTAELNLEGPRPAVNATSGFLKIEKFVVKNGNSEIASERPIHLGIKNGAVEDREFTISGGNNYFKFSSNKSSLSHLDVKIDGRLDLLLVSMLTPFLDDLRGTIAINVGIAGPISSPNFMGSLILQDGFVRLKNFPHPFEQIKGDLLFSQKKLLINTVRGRLAGGIVSGGGQIEFVASDNIPIDIRGAFQDCVFNVPAGISTRGSGEFYIHGNSAPYTLGGLYSIYSGSLDKKINASEDVAREVKPSPYLPKFLVEKQLSPIQLDLEMILQNPISVSIQMPQVTVKTAVDGRLVVKGPPDSTLLTGRFNLVVPSTINVRDNVFNITGGTVEYKGFPPDNPELNVSAESRINLILKDNIEREYDVYARFTGPAQKLNIQMTSQPQLSEQELISLVTLGYVNESDSATDVNNPSAQASSTGYQIGSQFLDEQLGINRRLEKTLGVNFKYSSSFDATDQAARHTFILKKQWSPRFGTSASRSVGKSDTNNVRAEYKLNRNMSVIGSWEGKEQTGADKAETEEGETNIFGLDLEFKREFK